MGTAFQLLNIIKIFKMAAELCKGVFVNMANRRFYATDLYNWTGNLAAFLKPLKGHHLMYPHARCARIMPRSGGVVYTVYTTSESEIAFS